MNNQEEWCRQWEEAFLRMHSDAAIYASNPVFLHIAKVNDPGHSHEVSQTMIYSGEEAKALADSAVKQAVLDASKEPLSEEEKDRLWKAVLESCSG